MANVLMEQRVEKGPLEVSGELGTLDPNLMACILRWLSPMDLAQACTLLSLIHEQRSPSLILGVDDEC